MESLFLLSLIRHGMSLHGYHRKSRPVAVLIGNYLKSELELVHQEASIALVPVVNATLILSHVSAAGRHEEYQEEYDSEG